MSLKGSREKFPYVIFYLWKVNTYQPIGHLSESTKIGITKELISRCLKVRLSNSAEISAESHKIIRKTLLHVITHSYDNTILGISFTSSIYCVNCRDYMLLETGHTSYLSLLNSLLGICRASVTAC